MSDIQRKLERVVASANQKLLTQQQILPVKTADGILVGSVLIKSRENQKDLWQNGNLIYEGVFLNKAAIKISNILAFTKRTTRQTDDIYKADQYYGQHFVDSQILRLRLHLSREKGDHDKADIYLARYLESKNRVETAKKQVYALTIP